MGLMNLVWLWFPYQFWPNNYNFFGVTRPNRIDEPSSASGDDDNYDQEMEFTTFLGPQITDQYGNQQPILMCQVSEALLLLSVSIS
jgi:hypothetical protein